MALIRIINKAKIQRDEPVRPVQPAKGELLINRGEIIGNCGYNGFIWEFSRDYNGPMVFGITNDSKISGKILIGKNVDYPTSETIVKNFSYEDRGTELININVKKGYKLKLEFNNGEFIKHEGQNKPAQCGITNKEVIVKGVNHTTYRIGFGDEGQYGGEKNTPVYILKPKKPKEPDVVEVVAPAQPGETSGGGYYDDGHRDNAPDLPSGNYVPIGGGSNEWERSM